MPIYGIEWIVVGVIIIVLLLWGPEKLPKIARSIGQAKREFEKASKALEEETSSVVKPSIISTSSGSVAAAQAGDDKLLEVAKSLGISTEGKTRDEIAREIVNKAQQKQG
ncbi:MAG: twin-arginine translocase TatA/TatE family subunit [Aigarchaeota archaeon]|nr:twin-arginine translocase TatA/TatE family subunit [Candidatus Pelearchaeum maunauluense]